MWLEHYIFCNRVFSFALEYTNVSMLLNGIIALLLLHSIICKYPTKKFIWLTFHFYLSNGGRILRYNRCECGIENIQNVNYDRIGKCYVYKK